MSETVLDVGRRELDGARVTVRVIQDGEMFRLGPADFSDDTDTNLADLPRRSGTLLHVGARDCLHLKTEASARAAVLRSLPTICGVKGRVDGPLKQKVEQPAASSQQPAAVSDVQRFEVARGSSARIADEFSTGRVLSFRRAVRCEPRLAACL